MAGHEIIGLFLAAVAAGVINAVAGGGTLVTFPTLLAFGTPPVVANATSTLALALGTAGSVYGYRRHLADVRVWLWRFLPVSVVGSLLGGWLLTRTTDRAFSKMVPFLILFATVLFLAQSLFRKFAGLDERGERHARHHVWGAIIFQFAVAVYGGFFGAGIGILMLATLGFLGLENIHQMNSLKTTLGAIINLVAAIWFVFAGLIDWPKAAVMTVGAFTGYYFGSHFSQKIPQKYVRQIITAIGFVLSVMMFYKEFLK